MKGRAPATPPPITTSLGLNDWISRVLTPARSFATLYDGDDCFRLSEKIRIDDHPEDTTFSCNCSGLLATNGQRYIRVSQHSCQRKLGERATGFLCYRLECLNRIKNPWPQPRLDKLTHRCAAGARRSWRLRVCQIFAGQHALRER